MDNPSDERVEQFYAETYDEAVPDWPGEMDFWRSYAAEVRAKRERLLDVACGTGRVGIRLAQEGTGVTGLDLSESMLEKAREKSRDVPGMEWVHSDMCAFDLGRTFGLAIIGGHAFHNLNTPSQQAACLDAIHRHLVPGGRLILHLDHQNVENVEWLGGLAGKDAGVFHVEKEFTHPGTGRRIRQSQAWSYEPSTQTCISQLMWEALGDDGQVLETWKTEPNRLHAIFRFEVEHALKRTGYEIEALYGDFFRHPLEDKSPGMIWVARA